MDSEIDSHNKTTTLVYGEIFFKKKDSKSQLRERPYPTQLERGKDYQVRTYSK